MVGLADLLEDPDSNFEPGVQTEAVGSVEDVPHFSPSDPGVSIEGEYLVEFLKVTGGEDWVVGSQFLGEEGLEILVVDFFFCECHEISLITINKIIDSRTKVR